MILIMIPLCYVLKKVLGLQICVWMKKIDFNQSFWLWLFRVHSVGSYLHIIKKIIMRKILLLSKTWTKTRYFLFPKRPRLWFHANLLTQLFISQSWKCVPTFHANLLIQLLQPRVNGKVLAGSLSLPLSNNSKLK